MARCAERVCDEERGRDVERGRGASPPDCECALRLPLEGERESTDIVAIALM